MTEPPSLQRIQGLTFGTLSDKDRAISRSSWGAVDVVTSVAVLVAIIAAYLYFSPVRELIAEFLR